LEENNLLECPICNHDFLKLKDGVVAVIINGSAEFICDNCYKFKFSKYSNKKCEVCGNVEKTNNAYFFKKGKQISLVCRECHDRVYGDGKE